MGPGGIDLECQLPGSTEREAQRLVDVCPIDPDISDDLVVAGSPQRYRSRWIFSCHEQVDIAVIIKISGGNIFEGSARQNILEFTGGQACHVEDLSGHMLPCYPAHQVGMMSRY